MDCEHARSQPMAAGGPECVVFCDHSWRRAGMLIIDGSLSSCVVSFVTFGSVSYLTLATSCISASCASVRCSSRFVLTRLSLQQ